MNKPTLLILLVLLLPVSIFAQKITLSVSPVGQETSGNDLNYTLKIAGENFNKQVFLNIYSTDLPSTVKFTFSQTVANYPYNDVQLKISGLENVLSGDYKIIVKAYNGPVSTTDTCIVKISGTDCRWYSSSITGSYIGEKFVIDKSNVKWTPNYSSILKIFPDGTKTAIYSGQPDISIYQLFLSPGNTIWGTCSKGLFKIEGENFFLFTSENSGIPVMQIRYVEFYDGKVYLASNLGLVEYDGTFWSIYNSSNSNLKYDNLIYLKKDKKGNLVAGGCNCDGLNGLYITNLYNFNSGNFSDFLLPSFEPFNLAIIHKFDFDRDNNLWYIQELGKEFGVFKITATTAEMWGNGYYSKYGYLKLNSKRDTLDRTSGPLINTVFIKDLLISSNGDVWVCQATGGIGEVYQIKGKEVNKFNQSNSDLPKPNYYSLSEDSTGTIWILAYDGQYAYFSCNGPVVTSIEQSADNSKEEVAYPNPVSDMLNINFSGLSGKIRYHLNDATGTRYLSGESDRTADMTELDLKNLPAGVYYLQINSLNGSKTEKIIKY